MYHRLMTLGGSVGPEVNGVEPLPFPFLPQHSQPLHILFFLPSCLICTYCTTHTAGHPSIADEVWYSLKHALGECVFLAASGVVVLSLFILPPDILLSRTLRNMAASCPVLMSFVRCSKLPSSHTTRRRGRRKEGRRVRRNVERRGGREEERG